MNEKGQVVSTKDNYIEVKVLRKSACAHCGKCPGSSDSQYMLVEVKNDCGAVANDWVSINMDNNPVTTATVVLYGIPLVSFMVGTLLGYYVLFSGLSTREPLSFFFGIMLIALTYVIIRLNEKKFKNQKFMPSAVRILSSDEI